MNSRLDVKLFQTPRAQQFMNNVIEDLRQGRSVLLLIPVGHNLRPMWELVREELLRLEFHIGDIWLPGLASDQGVVAAISDALQVQWDSSESPRTLDNLFLSTQMPDIVYLEGFSELPTPERPAWAGFLYQWAEGNHRVADRGGISRSLFIVASAPEILPYLPNTDIHLAVYWWCGIPSALELQLLCRSEENGAKLTARSRWREHIIPSLAGGDIILANHLWDNIQLDTEELIGQLRVFAKERGWTTTILQKWGVADMDEDMPDSYEPASHGPPVRLRNLWAQGAIVWTQEYGFELHSAALLVLEQHEELSHRIWRGQAALLLPEIDALRLELCNCFTRHHGSDWPLLEPSRSPEENKAVRNNPLACQWGHLESLLRNCRILRSERNRLPLVRQARYIRNELAHYRPIDFSTFESICQEIRRSPSL